MSEERALQLLQQCNGDVQEALDRCRAEILRIQEDIDYHLNDDASTNTISHNSTFNRISDLDSSSVDNDITLNQASRRFHSAWSNKDIQNLFPYLTR